MVPTEQRRFLEQHPEVDFYIDGEGEAAFVNLFRSLADINFDLTLFKSRGTRLSNVHYVLRGTSSFTRRCCRGSSSSTRIFRRRI